jgi:hypothetical protein
MNAYVLGLQDINGSRFDAAGGKAANLGELATIEEIRVPDGFCVTTAAYRQFVERDAEIDALLHQLAPLEVGDRKAIGEVSANIRKAIKAIALPQNIATEIAGYLMRLGDNDAFAVCSSATAEDLPSASFAGQHDTFLNVVGKKSSSNTSATAGHRCSPSEQSFTAFRMASIIVESTCLCWFRRWSALKRQAFSSLPIPSRPTARHCPSTPASGLVRRWSPAW